MKSQWQTAPTQTIPIQIGMGLFDTEQNFWLWYRRQYLLLLLIPKISTYDSGS